MARQLTRYAEVLFVDPPVSRMTVRSRPELARALSGPPLRRIEDRLHHLVPWVVPGKDRPGLTRLASMQARRRIREAVRQLGAEIHATVLTLPQRDLFDDRLGGRRVYWAKDDHVAGAHLYGLDPGRLARAEEHLVARSDSFVVCSQALAEHWRDRGADPTVLPNGCDVGHFAYAQQAPLPVELRSVQQPYAVFVGTLTERVDARFLQAVAEAGIRIVLVGGQRRTSHWDGLDAIVEHPNVTHVGTRSFEQLPAFLGGAAVGLLPYVTDRYNQHSFPLKLLEYLAAGLPVVSSDLPAARWLGTSLVQCAEEPATFVAAVRAALDGAQGRKRAAACRAVAAEHDWRRRAEQLSELLGLRGRSA